MQTTFTRRTALGLLGAAGAAVALPSLGEAAVSGVTDADIFNFALNLESLETEYYLWGTMGRGMASADIGVEPGPVNGGHLVPWKDESLRSLLTEVANNELAHVRFYRKTLGADAVCRPQIDLAGGFAAAAKAAGLGDGFDPFASEMNFLLGGMMMEDVGVTAYNGAVPLIQNKTFQQAASGILAVEAYHMGMARSLLYKMGGEAWRMAEAISNARDSVDGPGDVDQPIAQGGKANFVPADANAIAFTRTPQQVLNIVYLTPNKGVGKGGLFPVGMNGKIYQT